MASPLLTFHIQIFTTLLVFAASSTDPLSNAFLQCFKPQFSTDNIIYTPVNGSSYASLLQSQNSRQLFTSRMKPLAIITPFHESQIQAAINCSRKTGLPVRVRSGGHDYEGLSYTADTPFVVVDMRNFTSVEIDMDNKTAWVGVGATLGRLYYMLSQKSKTLALPAGVCPTVGVGGHFSGGGYSMMSRNHSIASDHIIDAKLIDAEGRILNRMSMGEDLFWAIRGGGGTSFGIVLAFKVELVVVPEITTVFNVTRMLEQNATRLVHKWQYIADRVDDRLMLRLFLNSITSPTGRNKTVAASFTTLFLGCVNDLLPIMQDKFPELGLEEKDCIEMSWIESVVFFAGLGNQSSETLLNLTALDITTFKGKSDYVRDPIPIHGLTGIWKFLLEKPDRTIELQLTPSGGAINAYSESETPFPHRSGNIFMIHYALVWFTPGKAEAERELNWMRGLYHYMGTYVSKSPRTAYFNYRDLDIGANNNGNTSYEQASIWGSKYFKNNFKRLVCVKTKVDPSNFFQNEQSIPPLTSDESSSSVIKC